MKANICGDKIRTARKEAGLGQVDLAVALQEHDIHIGQADISEIETDTRLVRDYELKAIAEILEVSADWLLED
jgi:transcriptional regulator with XRE-family HTH domain